jgi:hypothetical protein
VSQASTLNPEKAFRRGRPEGFSEIITDFKGASRNFILNFLHKKAAKM